jgi:Rieske Fe-S protein
MSTGEKKPTVPPTTTPPSPAPTPAKPPQLIVPPAQGAKATILSRRNFLKVAVGASVAAAGASLLISYVDPGTGQLGGILSPLIPKPKGPMLITNAATLETAYDAIRGQTGQVAYQFFYWPYDPSLSPYYKNALVRIPDELLDSSVRGSTPNLAHYDAWNLTCVHLRCIVNPGYDQASQEYRLRCPCHGSQYRLTTAVPVAGPAFDLGLRPLPRIILSMDSSNNLIAERFDGEPGIGRTD